MLSRLILSSTPIAVMAGNGGCKKAFPDISTTCDCNLNPNVSKYAGCSQEGNPVYINDMNDLPNGACLAYESGQKKGSGSFDNCKVDSDCIGGLVCGAGRCKDPKTGIFESDRRVMFCASPKKTSKSIYAGCPYGGGQGSQILECHKYWISDEGMEWKRYL